MRKTIFLLLTILTFRADAQYLFPVKLENCKIEKFCLDCGDIKAGYDTNEFLKLQKQLNRKLDVRGLRGAIKFQVLIDSKGKACVLSHTDPSNNPNTIKIIDEIHKFKKWTPAITSGKKEEKTSIILVFLINDNEIIGQIERVEPNTFKLSFNTPRNPEIYNKTYQYKTKI